MEPSTLCATTPSAQPAKKRKFQVWQNTWKEKKHAKSTNKQEVTKLLGILPKKPTLLLTSSHGIERPYSRPGFVRPPWMLIDCESGKTAEKLLRELPGRRLPRVLQHAVVMIGGNDVSVKPSRRAFTPKPNNITASNTAWNLLQIYRFLRFSAQVPRVTVVELLPRPGDEVYLPGLVDRTNELIGNYMSNNGYDHDVLKVKNMKEEHFVDGVHLNRRGFYVLMDQLAAWCI